MRDAHRMFRSRAAIRGNLLAYITLLVLLGLGVVPGCTLSIRPPKAPRDPVAVAVIDYGRHSSLLLPAENGAKEYTYGEWKWFALGRDSWYRVFPVLFWPTQGTLGRVEHRVKPEAIRAERWGAEAVWLIYVERRRAEELLSQLDARFEKHLAEKVYNRAYGTLFVPDDQPYTLLYNCNDAVAEWLEELGCEVCGRALTADFEVQEPEGGG